MATSDPVYNPPITGGGTSIAVGVGTAGRFLLVDAAGTVVSASDDLSYAVGTKIATLSASNSGGIVGLTISNTSNTAGSSARKTIQVAGATADDPFLVWSINGVTNVAAGLDNSTTRDVWTMNAGTALSSSVNGLRFDPQVGNFSFGTIAPSATTGRFLFVRDSLPGARCEQAWQNTSSTGIAGINLVTAAAAIDLESHAASGSDTFLGVSTLQAAALRMSSGTGGLKIGTSHAADLLLGTNNVARIKYLAAGGQQMLTGNILATREISNADATITVADGSVAQTGTLSANRTFTLPTAASVPNGFRVLVSVNAVAGTGFKVIVTGDINVNGAATYDLDTDWETATLVKHTSEWRVF